MDQYIKLLMALTVVFVIVCMVLNEMTGELKPKTAYERCLRIFSEEYQGDDAAPYHCAFITGYAPFSQ